MEIRLFHGITGKHPKDPCTGDCGVAEFIWIEICPLVSNVPSLSVLPWKKSNCIFRKTKTKASAQHLGFILKLSLLEPTHLLEALVAGLSSPHGSMLPGKRTWEKTGKWGVTKREKERERE